MRSLSSAPGGGNSSRAGGKHAPGGHSGAGGCDCPACRDLGRFAEALEHYRRAESALADSRQETDLSATEAAIAAKHEARHGLRRLLEGCRHAEAVWQSIDRPGRYGPDAFDDGVPPDHDYATNEDLKRFLASNPAPAKKAPRDPFGSGRGVQ